MKIKITDGACRTAPRPEGRKYVMYDTVLHGFIVEVRAGGMTFWFRYTDARGRQRQIRIGAYGVITVEQARRRAAELAARRALGEDPAADRDAERLKPTVASRICEYMAAARERLRSAANVAVYMRRIEGAMGNKGLDEVTPHDVAAFRRRLLAEGLKGGTVNRHLAYLRAFFNDAIRAGALEGRNPAASPNMLREQHRDVYLSPHEARALIKALDEEPNRGAAAVIALLLLTGARRSEVLNARHCDVDLDRGLLTVPLSKSGRTRHIPLSHPALLLFKIQRCNAVPGNDYVFPGSKLGRPLESVRGPWERARRRAGLRPDLRLHDLRHTFASTLANAGVPINEIGTVLGHSQLATTTRYAHHSPQRLIETAGIAARALNLLPDLVFAAD